MKTRQIGQLGEKLAAGYLKKKGYRIIATNYSCRFGEIDIIASAPGQLVFVEVRSKTGTGFGRPEESITRAKAGRLIATCEYYRQHNDNLPENYRIDLVAVMLGEDNSPVSIEHFPGAIEIS